MDVEIEKAKPGTKWRVVLKQNGKRVHKRVHKANARGKVDIDKSRPNTRGKDVFKLRVKKVGGPKACVRKIIMK